MNKKYEFRIQENTDNVDINSKCLGLSAWVVGDGISILNTNRGLHVQILHNEDKHTFDAGVHLSRLLSNAPAMLDFIRRIVVEQADLGDHGDAAIIREGEDLLSKIERQK